MRLPCAQMHSAMKTEAASARKIRASAGFYLKPAQMPDAGNSDKQIMMRIIAGRLTLELSGGGAVRLDDWLAV